MRTLLVFFALDEVAAPLYTEKCAEVVELGRHTILRGWRVKTRAGSSPAFGTTRNCSTPGLRAGFFVL